jgi:anti-sigma-K factor RskA
VPPAAPPPDAWSRIESAIAAASAAPSRPSLWQSLAFWRGLAAVSTSLAAATIAALAYVALAPAPLTATLGSTAGQPNFVAAVTATGNTLVIVPAALLTNDPHAYELWLIPNGETRPRSLGLIEPRQPVRLEIPAGLARRITRDATLAVSVEPPGGSPTGQPTGPVIAAGKLMNL